MKPFAFVLSSALWIYLMVAMVAYVETTLGWTWRNPLHFLVCAFAFFFAVFAVGLFAFVFLAR